MSVAEIQALKVVRIRGVVRRHEKKPGMASVAAIGRCPGGLHRGDKVWGLLSAASAFAVPGAAKVPANTGFLLLFFLSTGSEVSVTLVRFWDALWWHRFYVRIIQVITPLSGLDPSPSVFLSLLEDEELSTY